MTRPGLPKMIVTDLDGTLVRNDDTVSEYTHEVLARVRLAGIHVVGATGRGPRLKDLVYRDMPSAEFLVMAGGGHVLNVTNINQPIVLRDKRIDGKVLARIFEALEAEVGTLSIMVEASDKQNAPLCGDLDPAWRYPELFEVQSRAEALRGPVIKGFAKHHRYNADELLVFARRLVPERIATITQAGLGYIEICPPGVDKATGLAVVAQALGVDPSDVLAFGDMPNDIPMLRWARFRGVAVANAHPEVLAVVDEVTLSNDNSGVAVYLDRMLNHVSELV